jgi:transglutaminase-like putative cysteine protease
LREPIDHIQAVLISFVMLLACSIITNSILYIVFMLGFIMLVMLDLICYTVAQEANRATAWFDPAADGGARAQERVLFRRVFASTMGVAVLVLITAHLLFFIMPHYATQRGYRGFSPRDEPDEAVSGFSENLDLNALSRISLDNTQIMEIKVAWEGDDRDLPPPDQLWLRGSNLAVFDAQGWHTEFPARLKQSDEWRVINLPYSVSERRPVLRQEIRQHVGRLRRLFGAGDAFSMEYGGLVVSHLNWNAEAVDIVMRQSFGGDFSYKVNSVIPPDGLITLGRLARAQARLPESAAALPPAERIERMRQFDPAIPRPDAALFLRESERRLYTRLPRMPLTQIVRDVAAQRVRGRSEIESILNLHRWFSAAFEYSLVPDTPPGMHPLEGFLLHTHKGHCEYFASAMVLLLRAKGIPARVVTGYYTTEYSPETSVFRVRQSDAHAWCELWQDALGWLPIDPTPPFYRGRASLDTYEPPFWKSLRDDLRSMWQIYILDYSSNAKAELLAELFQQPFGERLGGLVDRLRAVAVKRFSDRSLARLDFLKAGEQSLLPLARSLLAVFLLIALWGIYRRRRRRLLAADPALSPVAL